MILDESLFEELESKDIKVKVTNIDWETDDEKVDLPKEDTINVKIYSESELEDQIANALSEKHGWLVSSFNYEVLDNLKEESEESKPLSIEDKFKFIKEYPTYVEGHRRYFTRPCKAYDLGLTSEQENNFFKMLSDPEGIELSNFWIENAELSDNIYQAGRMGGHLILDDERAMPADYDGFDSFEDVVDHERHIWDEADAREEAESSVNETYKILVDFDNRVDQLIDNLKITLDGYVNPEGLNESWDSKYFPYNPELGWTEEDIELHKSIDWKARNYEEYEVEEDSFKAGVEVVGKDVDENKVYTFHKFLRPNPIYPPYYRAVDFDIEGLIGPTYNGRKHFNYDIHDRYETQEVYDMLSEDVDSEVDREVKWVFANNDQELAYQMLDRLRSDCAYILGAVKDNSEDGKTDIEVVNKFLWFHDIDKQIDFMKKIYNKLDEKPEWISLEEIDNLGNSLKAMVRLDEEIEVKEKTADELNRMISDYSKEVEKYTKENNPKEAEWYQKQIDWAKEQLSKKEALTEKKKPDIVGKVYDELAKINVKDKESGQLSHPEVYGSRFRPGYKLELDDETGLQDAIEVAKNNNLEYKVRNFRNFIEFYVFFPEEILEEDRELDSNVSKEEIEELAKKHNITITFLDDNDVTRFHSIGKTSDLDRFYDEYVEILNSKPLKEELEPVSEEDKKAGMLATLNSLIKEELDAVQSYNDAVEQAKAIDMEDFASVFESLISEETIHIGELQKLQDILSPKTIDDIEAGQEEAEEHIENQEEKTE